MCNTKYDDYCEAYDKAEKRNRVAAQHVQKLIGMLYSKEPLDKEAVEFCLADITDWLDMGDCFPEGELNICRPSLFNFAIDLSRNLMTGT